MGRYTKALNQFHWGQFFLSKIQWIVNIIILLKVFDMPLWSYIVFPIELVLFTWWLGIFIDVTGLRLTFIRENYKGTNIK